MVQERLFIAILLLLAPFAASADTITYDYSGPALPAAMVNPSRIAVSSMLLAVTT